METPLDDFFARYPRFRYNNTAPVTAEFNRMVKFFNWSKEERAQVREEFRDSLTKQFNACYGTELDDWDAWRNLCRMVNIWPVPDTMEECRNAVKAKHVNLVDFVDAPRTGEAVNVFQSEYKLSKYTKATGKYFPPGNAYAGGILRFLLRHIMFPRDRPNGRKNKRTRRRQGI